MSNYSRSICIALLLTLAGYGLFRFGQDNLPDRIIEFAHPAPAHKAAAAENPLPPSLTVTVPILMYHHVGDTPPNSDAIRRDLTVGAGDFEAQVAWLAAHQYHSVTLQEVYQATHSRGALPDKPVVFTFDDGYTDALDNAVPILRRYGFTGSFAIITKFPGLPGYASWDEIRSAQAQGMEMVSHTTDHFDGGNSKFTYEFIKQDLTESQNDLKKNLGVETKILIYPYGHYTSDYIRAARETGFVMGLTVAFGKQASALNLMTTPRVRVHGKESLDRFIELVAR
jgi:peptidoglycan/xylan/chitin deacetylase (PgdA/CDA1 family)